MKAHSIIPMVVFMISSFFVSAQNANPRAVSKDVQKVAHKDLFSNEHIFVVASVGYPAWTISKQAQLVPNRLDAAPAPGNLPSVGYPAWIISKGVHRKATAPVGTAPSKPATLDIIAEGL